MGLDTLLNGIVKFCEGIGEGIFYGMYTPFDLNTGIKHFIKTVEYEPPIKMIVECHTQGLVALWSQVAAIESMQLIWDMKKNI